MESTVPFAKMNGLGNDIVVIDMRGRSDTVTSEAAIALAAGDRTGFRPDHGDPRHRSRRRRLPHRHPQPRRLHSQACGNGTRCVVQALASETGTQDFHLQDAGRHSQCRRARRRPDFGRYGRPRFPGTRSRWPRSSTTPPGSNCRSARLTRRCCIHPRSVPIGNPHAVFWVKDDVWSYDLERFGPLLENHPIFPERPTSRLPG
jgi:diaminopimelate epimerase